MSLPNVTSGLVVVWGLALTGAVQDEKAVPAFPTRAEAVTLDVVVVDKQGRPVRGLTAADFIVLEEGQPQVVVAFEAVDLAAGSLARPPTTGDPGAGSRPPDSTKSDLPARNPQLEASQSERAFVFVIDDLGLDFGSTIAVKKAITQWLTTQALPTDEVTLVTTSGDLSWNDRVATGRENLLGILGRVNGGRHKAPFVLSVGEAYLINETPVGDGGAIPLSGAPIGPQTLLARLVRRAADAGACVAPPPAECEAIVRIAARELYDRVARTSRTILGSVARLSRLMGPRRGRKSIVVFSESFVRGTNRPEEEAALRASQTANTAVYLVDAKGLVADPFFNAEFRSAPPPIDLSTQSLDGGVLDGGYLADATGGRTIRNDNDLTSGLGRILDESSAYYRIGYQPEKAPDGRWRKLKVEVRRRKVEARTRRGYFSSPAVVAQTPKPDGPSAPTLTPEPKGAPAPDPVLALILEKAGA
jgi:VWFA-related protein